MASRISSAAPPPHNAPGSPRGSLRSPATGARPAPPPKMPRACPEIITLFPATGAASPKCPAARLPPPAPPLQKCPSSPRDLSPPSYPEPASTPNARCLPLPATTARLHPKMPRAPPGDLTLPATGPAPPQPQNAPGLLRGSFAPSYRSPAPPQPQNAPGLPRDRTSQLPEPAPASTPKCPGLAESFPASPHAPPRGSFAPQLPEPGPASTPKCPRLAPRSCSQLPEPGPLNPKCGLAPDLYLPATGPAPPQPQNAPGSPGIFRSPATAARPGLNPKMPRARPGDLYAPSYRSPARPQPQNAPGSPRGSVRSQLHAAALRLGSNLLKRRAALASKRAHRQLWGGGVEEDRFYVRRWHEL